MGHLEYFRPNYQHPFGTVSPLSMFFIIQSLFLQKTKSLYPHPKYLFAIWIWIWAAKNQGFSLHVSVVLEYIHTQSPTFNITQCVSRLEKKTYFIRGFLDFFLISTTFTTGILLPNFRSLKFLIRSKSSICRKTFLFFKYVVCRILSLHDVSA